MSKVRIRLLMFTCPKCHHDYPDHYRAKSGLCEECEAEDPSTAHAWRSRRPISEAILEAPKRTKRPR